MLNPYNHYEVNDIKVTWYQHFLNINYINEESNVISNLKVMFQKQC